MSRPKPIERVEKEIESLPHTYDRHYATSEWVAYTKNPDISSYTSIARLETMQQTLETVVEALSSRRHADAGELQKTLEIRQLFISLLQSISQRNAELVKVRDGELLTGETVPPPSKPSGIYRVRQRTRRN